MSRLPLVILVLALLSAHPVASAQSAATEVIAVGSPTTMHAQATERIAAQTGVQPSLLGGAGPATTAVAVSQHTWPGGAGTVLLATTRDFADALAAAPLLGDDGGTALLLVDPDAVPEVTAAELARLAPDRVIVLGGPVAISDDVVGAVAAITGHAPERLAGTTRFQTAAAISDRAHPDGADVVVVASGEGWADALAATSLVDEVGAALVLTAHGFLPSETADALVALEPTEVIVLGGTAAVMDPVVAHIGAVTGVAPARLAGPTRYETAAAIADRAHPEGTDRVYAATGRDWPDALVAAVSTLKVMVMVAHLRQPAVRDRDLTAEDLALLEPMITQSANSPASRILDAIGPAPLQQLAAEAGMQDFAYTRPWGNSRTSPRDQAQLMLRLPELLPDRHRAYAMDLLTRVVPEQRWGIGQLDLPGWQVHFKGGWGSGTGSADHQVVRLQREDGTAVALAVMTTSNPSHAHATDTLEAVFRELLATLP